MIFQEDTPEPSSFSLILKKILHVLNTPFVDQQGGIHISIMSLLMFGAIIFGAVIVSRYIRGFLSKRVMPRFHHLDVGLQYTLLRVLHYVIMIGATLWAVKLGLAVDLTGVAVVLGFLSVGVGFGLQYLAADLASGFILLFERPVRVGDQVKMGEIEGRVQSIRLRSTTLMTNDGATIIMPNSDLVRSKVTNWSFSQGARIKIPIGVEYGSDVQTVTEALLNAARGVEKVMPDPPPKVLLKGFGESAVDFELLVWITHPNQQQQVRSDIYYQIDRLFREQGIKIPTPTSDFYLHADSMRDRSDMRFVMGEHGDEYDSEASNQVKS